MLRLKKLVSTTGQVATTGANLVTKKEMAPMKKTLAPSVTTRDPKGRKFISIVETAYNKANLSNEEAQHVNDTPGLAEHIAHFISKNRNNNRFEDEEVHSSMRYPKEYKGPKPINTQIEALAAIFDLDPASALQYTKELPKLPHGAEGWFAVPSIDALFPEVSDPAEKYCRAIQLVLDKIAASRTFRNWRIGQITSERIRLTTHTTKALAELAKTQSGDILIIAAQLGMRHRGCSVRRARARFTKKEFGLGSVMGGSIALTHPTRFICFDELDMDLPGDEFNEPLSLTDSTDSFDFAPYFYFCDDTFMFGAQKNCGTTGQYGSASAFLHNSRALHS